MSDKPGAPDRRQDVAALLNDLVPQLEALDDAISELDPREADVSRVLDVMQHTQRKLTSVMDDYSLLLGVQVEDILKREVVLRKIVGQWQRNEETDSFEVIGCDDALRRLYRVIDALTGP